MVLREMAGAIAVTTGSATVYGAVNAAIPILANLQQELYKNPLGTVLTVSLAVTEVAVVGGATAYAAKALVQGPARKLNHSLRALGHDVKLGFRQYVSDCGPLGLLFPAGFPVYYVGLKIAKILDEYHFSRKEKEN